MVVAGGGVSGPQPNFVANRSSIVQAILLTSSLLLVLAMVGSLAWLSTLRVPHESEAVPAEIRDELP